MLPKLFALPSTSWKSFKPCNLSKVTVAFCFSPPDCLSNDPFLDCLFVACSGNLKCDLESDNDHIKAIDDKRLRRHLQSIKPNLYANDAPD
jgi:hypothetical protein